MRYGVLVSEVHIVGELWYGGTATTTRKLSEYDVANIEGYADGEPIDRDAVDRWMRSNVGDFQDIIDFYATIETQDGETIEIPWGNEENELTWLTVECDDLYEGML